MTAHRLLSRLFSCEEINGRERCPTYLYRWIVLSKRRLGVYVHRFVADDWSRDLHDHPKRFVSIGVWGRYTEETPRGSVEYRAPWVRTFPAEHIHRIRLTHGECRTVVIVGPPRREWGFWTGGFRGVFVPWKKYVNSELADKAKACP